MNKTTVTLKMRNAPDEVVSGYLIPASQSPFAHDLVVHRVPWERNCWGVTEPRTGMRVIYGGNTRAHALNLLVGLGVRLRDPAGAIVKALEDAGVTA